MPAVAKLVPEETIFFLCDVQTRFKNLIFGIDELVLTINKMLKIAKVLGIPVVVTEQNPKDHQKIKALETPSPDIDLPSLGPLLVTTIEKGLFSMMTPESQVCVLQSALDLIEAGYNVHVVADGVSSSNKEEIPFALARIQQSGGYITTSESVAFQLQRALFTPNYGEAYSLIPGDAGLPGFKRTSQKLLQHRSFL
ncbi:Isochorismatase-like protein [Suillus lakei]|nr:Isochorismatase-like protein [Suillus lakei]